MKLLVRGGSIPAGYGVERSYVDIISKKIPHIDIINNSHYKDTTFQGVWTFYEDIEVYAPEILILHFGIDDAYHPVYRSEFKENLVQIVRLSRKRFDPEIILLTSHPFKNHYDMEIMYIYYRVIREVAQDLSCNYIPVHALWAGDIEEKGLDVSCLIQADTRYPTEAGHKLYAKYIMQKIESYFHN